MPEACPACGNAASVRRKLVLIDAEWGPGPGKDSRLAHFADLRVDDIEPENLADRPLEPFIDGYHCDACGKGFVSEAILTASRRRYR